MIMGERIHSVRDVGCHLIMQAQSKEQGDAQPLLALLWGLGSLDFFGATELLCAVLALLS